MAQKILLTPSAIDALRKGCLHDLKTPGLILEILQSGKKSWKYARRIPGRKQILRSTLGFFPAHSIVDARKWADELNEQVEKGVNPRDVERADRDRARRTVTWAHELYMEAVLDGRASRAKRKNKPRTIKDKRKMFASDIAPKIGARSIYEITEDDLIKLINDKGKTAKIRANRLAAELKVFFGWAAGLRGKEVGLEVDPSRRLGDLKYPESPRTRKLSQDEIGWYLKGVAQEKSRTIRRGLLVLLLTAARISEVVLAGTEEVIDGTWTIPAERSKNHTAHSIKLGPWGQALMETEGAWIFKADRSDGPRKTGWYEARTRIHERMIGYAGRRLDGFCPHDLRRTARSNTKRLKVDFETAEAMLNHLKTGMERIYDGYDLEEEKAAWFLKWETEIAQIARDHGLARILEVADPIFSITSPVAALSTIEWQGWSGEAPSGMTITAGQMTPPASFTSLKNGLAGAGTMLTFTMHAHHAMSHPSLT